MDNVTWRGVQMSSAFNLQNVLASATNPISAWERDTISLSRTTGLYSLLWLPLHLSPTGPLALGNFHGANVSGITLLSLNSLITNTLFKCLEPQL